MRPWTTFMAKAALALFLLTAPAAPAHACTNPGDTCADGSIYVGLSPDGNEPMYTTPADAPSFLPWNDGNASVTSTTMVNCTSATPGSQASCQTGEANTALLMLEDSDSAVGGVQPHQAAAYCHGLSAHGHNDWYLPALDELDALYDNKNSGDLSSTFNESGSFPGGWYWSSSNAGFAARVQRFSDGFQGSTGKDNSTSVRCVRKGFPPDCLDPAGTIGQIAYNTTHDVFQACTRYAGWVALHSATPDPCAPENPVTPGTRCRDGSIYAGDTIGGARMYAAACDHGMTWDGSACTGSQTTRFWKTSTTTTTGTASLIDGVANTEAMATAGIALHPAAEACRSMGPEWYLPARAELDLIYDNLVDQDANNTPGGPLGSTFDFNITGFHPGGWYWSSSEAASSTAWSLRFTDGIQGFYGKNNGGGLAVRCVRRDP
jgi:hypothetical protein